MKIFRKYPNDFYKVSRELLQVQTLENNFKTQMVFADIGSWLLIFQNQHLLTVGGGSY